jgi:anti-anti-sigma factor
MRTLYQKRTVYPENSTVVIELKHTLDHSQVQILKQLLSYEIEQGSIHIILNFKHVPFLYSAHVAIFWAYHKKLKTMDGNLIFTHVPKSVYTIFGSMNLDKSLIFFQSDDEALLHLKPHQ